MTTKTEPSDFGDGQEEEKQVGSVTNLKVSSP